MPTTLTYRVPGMTCAKCTSAIEAEVARVSGVDAVSADLETKLVTVRGESPADGDLRAAIDEAGYEVDDGDA